MQLMTRLMSSKGDVDHLVHGQISLINECHVNDELEHSIR